MNDSFPESGIPLLTEIIPTPENPALPQPAARPAFPRAAGKAVVLPGDAVQALTSTFAAGPAGVSEEEKWRRLEKTVTERVMLQVLEHVDVIVQQRIREGLADLLQTMTEGLAAEIKDELRTVLQDTVPRITAAETAEFQDFKK